MSNLSRRSFVVGTAGMIVVAACAIPTRKRPNSTPVTFERDQFIDEVKRANREGQEAVAEVVARAVSDPASVIRELGEPTKASIHLLYKDRELSIYNLVWPPFAVLVPHDHLMWASIGVYTGRENNIMWEPSGKTIQAINAASVAAKEVFSLPPDAIHSVTNPVEGYTSALHVYGGDLSAAPRSQWDPRTLAQEPFDVEDGRRILQRADERFRDR